MEEYVAALDVGTTTVRCHILNSRAETVGAAADQVQLIYPQPGYVEIDPNQLWAAVVGVLKEAISNSGLTPKRIKCLGISTQRCSFTTWRRDTGKTLHNFITWKDVRADKLVQDGNNSFLMKAMNFGCSILHLVSRSKRFLAGSVLKFMNGQLTLRLVWTLRNMPEVQEAIADKTAMVGTVDSWLMYRLTGGKLHVTDVTNASATGMFDPFSMEWASWMQKMFSIPSFVMPRVVDNAMDFGETDPSILNGSIPIRALMADQCASLFGSCCFQPGDIKVTMGTGSFLDVNTGRSLHASVGGMYPLVGWKFGKDIAYVAEGMSSDTGTLIEWALKIDLLNKPENSSKIAFDIGSNDGVYFIPAFNGLGPPINDLKAAAGFVGLKPTTSKSHLVRSLLESIVFRISQVLDVAKKETIFSYVKIRVDGGVSKNNFVCQLLANMTGCQVERPSNSEMSMLGAAYMAGLYSGVWKSKDELKALRRVDRTFRPENGEFENYDGVFKVWEKAVERFTKFYDSSN